jgi:hypothetical protein
MLTTKEIHLIICPCGKWYEWCPKLVSEFNRPTAKSVYASLE